MTALKAWCVAGLLTLFSGAGSVTAQSLGQVVSPILTIDSERFFVQSAFGDAVAQAIREESEALVAENRRIEAELTAEEQDLTERRKALSPEEFTPLADVFDAKVKSIRDAQQEKARVLEQRAEDERLRFLEAAKPVLHKIMTEAGAALIIEQRSAIISFDVIDVTDLAIERVNSSLRPSDLPISDSDSSTESQE